MQLLEDNREEGDELRLLEVGGSLRKELENGMQWYNERLFDGVHLIGSQGSTGVDVCFVESQDLLVDVPHPLGCDIVDALRSILHNELDHSSPIVLVDAVQVAGYLSE